MTRHDLARLRLRHQHLSGRGLARPEDVVGWFGAVQAQELPYAKWSLGHRTRQSTLADVDSALDSGAILRTHVLRPTWHFVRREDLRWLLGVTAARIRRMGASYEGKLGLDDRVHARSQRIMARALADAGTSLTRAELGAALERAGLPGARGQPLGHVMGRAELDLVVCSGPARGNKQTYALFDERVPPSPAVPRDEALARLASRYLVSHGPATERDLAWWASLGLREARAAIASLGREVEELIVDGRRYFRVQPPTGRAASRPAARLLQVYDELIVAFTESRDLLFPAAGTRYLMSEFQSPHAIVFDGRVVGHWRLGRGDDVVVEARWSPGLPRTARAAALTALAAELTRYQRFVGAPVKLKTRSASQR